MKNIFQNVLLFFVMFLFFGPLAIISEASAHLKTDGKLNPHMPFISNEGQFDAKVKYYAKTFGGTVFVTEDGQWIYSLPQRKEAASAHKRHLRAERHGAKKELAHSNESKGLALKEELVGGKNSGVKGELTATAKVNYFRGNDENKWKADINTYDMVNLGEVYDGIELKLKAHGDNVEKLFYVKPGSKPEDIKVKLSGAQSLKITDTGELAVDTDMGIVKFTKPVAYQEINGKRVEVAAAYELSDAKLSTTDLNRVYGFKLGDYDKTKEVVIDPLLYSTYLGGSGSDLGLGIKVDSSGNIYIAGVTMSSDFPTTTGAFDRSFNGGNTDFFISKISPTRGLLYSTFMGGSADDFDSNSGEPYVFGMTIDAAGNVYLTGETFSSDFPTTSGVLSRTLKGNSDAFVLKLNSTGDSLAYSTLIGGTDNDQGAGIVVDASGTAYVAGETWSSDFPTTAGAFDRTYQGGDGDMFVINLNPTGSSFVYSTYIGGSDWDQATAIEIDNSGNAYILGGGASADFPTTAGAYDRTYNSDVHDYDIYILKLNATGNGLIASTFFGGIGREWSEGLAIDKNGNVFISGDVYSANFPTTQGAYDTHFDGSQSGYVSKFDSGLSQLLASTFFKGFPPSIATDSSGNVYIGGMTTLSSFPTIPGAYDTSFHGGVSNGGVLIDAFCSPTGCDAFVSKLDNNLTTLLASTFLGGNGNEYVSDITVDSSGKVYVVGITTSTDFPIRNGFASSHKGSEDVFVSVLDPNLSVGTNSCAATLSSSDFSIHVPIMDYAGYHYWVDFMYVPDLDFTIVNYGEVLDLGPYSACAHATLSESTLGIHIPDLLFYGYSYWADFAYKEGMTFTLVNYGWN